MGTIHGSSILAGTGWIWDSVAWGQGGLWGPPKLWVPLLGTGSYWWELGGSGTGWPWRSLKDMGTTSCSIWVGLGGPRGWTAQCHSRGLGLRKPLLTSSQATGTHSPLSSL